MRIGLLVPIFCLATGATDEAPRTSLDVVVERSAERPSVTSGFLAIWMDFDVRARDGTLHRMHEIYLSPDQFIAPVGAQCRVTFDRRTIEGSTSSGWDAEGTVQNVVRDISCSEAGA